MSIPNSFENITHLMIIPDGFRRYAKASKIEYLSSYKKGAKLGLDFLDYFNTAPVNELTYFLVSNRTFSRNKSSLDSIFKALNIFLDQLLCRITNREYNFKIKVLGDLKLVPKETGLLINKLESLNYNQKSKQFNLLISYSGTKNLCENLHIIKKISTPNIAIGESEEFNENLKNEKMTTTKIELVIRSGQYFRLSDAPILETINSNFILINKFLPELKVEDFEREITDYLKWKNSK